MNKLHEPAPEMPPGVARYLRGAPPESRQFDFLIGDWDVTAARFGDDGAVLLRYRASWHAKSVNEGRMIIDDFKALGPSGQAVSSFVTLRTWSEATRRWELAGLAALEPALNAQWHGHWTGSEMQLEATGVRPDGQAVGTRIRFFDIGKDSFSWESRTSLDGGANWVRSASLTASRVC